MTQFLSCSAALAVALISTSCRQPQSSIEFTKVPAAAEGTPFKLDPIEGRVAGAKPGQQVVLYAKAGVWYIQPLANKPFTTIQSDSTWRNSTHPGTDYAALLVEPGYAPLPTMRDLPAPGGGVVAVAVVKGTGEPPAAPPPKIVHFSGYNWEARRLPSPRGGKSTPYDPDNVWVDAAGFLHLKTTRQGSEWACAEVSLTHSLGQGLYLFTVRDVSHIDPATAMTLYTWDDLAADQHHREVDIEISRWGDPTIKNAQYALQPWEEPANAFRFEAPAGPLTWSFRWEPGKVSFKTVRGSSTIAKHEFTSGVPSQGGEVLKINVYVVGYSRIPPRSGSEVIIEKFEFLP